jgi:hypothetical protein
MVTAMARTLALGVVLALALVASCARPAPAPAPAAAKRLFADFDRGPMRKDAVLREADRAARGLCALSPPGYRTPADCDRHVDSMRAECTTRLAAGLPDPVVDKAKAMDFAKRFGRCVLF